MEHKRILRRAGQILCAVLLIPVAAILLGNLYLLAAEHLFGVRTPTLFGYRSAVVLTGSMSGTIEPDDLIVTKRQQTYAVGDIITFRSGDATVTHRITAIEPEGYRTKGDANTVDDPGDAIPEQQVIGKVILVIPKIGAAIRFCRTPVGMLCLLTAAALILWIPNAVGHRSSHTQQDGT